MSQLMKGETWADACKLVRGQPRFQYPVMVEAKADEIRCRVYKSGGEILFESYAEKPLHNLAFLASAFSLLFKQMQITELDVGILVNGNFNDSYRWVRSIKGLPTEKFDKKTGKTAPALDPSMVQIIVFDVPESTDQYIDRMIVADFAASGLRQYGVNAVRPARELCGSPEEVMACYAQYREAGYEGAMAKTLGHTYERRRTFEWMKIKPSEDHDGRITGFNEAVSSVDELCPETGAVLVPKGTPLARAGSINVETADGSTAAPAGIPHALGRELWANPDKYIGQWVEFTCMERDRQGGFRHPIFNRFREDK